MRFHSLTMLQIYSRTPVMLAAPLPPLRSRRSAFVELATMYVNLGIAWSQCIQTGRVHEDSTGLDAL